MHQRIKDEAAAIFEQVRGFRRHLHQHPELSFQEYQTSQYIQEQLKKMNIPFQTGFAENGVVALVEGKNAGKNIALRADIDALPIEEENKVSYCSANKGVMHACGHDAHTASLLGTAHLLHKLSDYWQGSVKFVFQPAEEKAPGGASLMIRDGVLKNPTPHYMLAQHAHPPLEVGKVGFRAGMAMASADEIYITIKGKGGHAATPQLVIDPVLISAHLVVALQQIVSRRADPTVPSVLSFGKINSQGGYNNIIPDAVKIEGTFRTFDEKWRFEAHRLIRYQAETLCAAMDAECEVNIVVGYPYLFNNEALTLKAKNAAIAFLGEENVVDIPMRMGAEDFAYYSQQVDSCFYRLGIRNEAKGIISNLHTPTFDIDEKALETGVGLMSWLAISLLQS
ncbi:MAG: amidohydrolase [Bacteroidetes bacterium]|nr:amidohydrolase [Bacteroidota bacterium]MCB9043491.1 amidohydrolase [Chitinophagales bacterium]